MHPPTAHGGSSGPVGPYVEQVRVGPWLHQGLQDRLGSTSFGAIGPMDTSWAIGQRYLGRVSKCPLRGPTPPPLEGP